MEGGIHEKKSEKSRETKRTGKKGGKKGRKNTSLHNKRETASSVVLLFFFTIMSLYLAKNTIEKLGDWEGDGEKEHHKSAGEPDGARARDETKTPKDRLGERRRNEKRKRGKEKERETERERARRESERDARREGTMEKCVRIK